MTASNDITDARNVSTVVKTTSGILLDLFGIVGKAVDCHRAHAWLHTKVCALDVELRLIKRVLGRVENINTLPIDANVLI